jgi:putative transposase
MEVKRRMKVIGRFPGEASCLGLCWAVMDLVIADGRGLGLTELDRQLLPRLREAQQEFSAYELTA